LLSVITQAFLRWHAQKADRAYAAIQLRRDYLPRHPLLWTTVLLVLEWIGAPLHVSLPRRGRTPSGRVAVLSVQVWNQEEQRKRERPDDYGNPCPGPEAAALALSEAPRKAGG
jgi:hypothetical protein